MTAPLLEDATRSWKLTFILGYRTSKIKALADVRPIAVDDADSIIRSFHLTLQHGEGKHQGTTTENGVAA